MGVDMTNGTACVMPKCIKRISALNLCAAHLAIVHAHVEQRQTLLNVDGHMTASARADQNARAAERMADIKAARRASGFVYFVQVGGHVKIGWTSDLHGRMRSYPPNSVLLAVQPGTRADEAVMHQRFATARTHGREWYAPVPSLLHQIEQVKREHGAPDVVVFGAQPVTVPEPRARQAMAVKSFRRVV